MRKFLSGLVLGVVAALLYGVTHLPDASASDNGVNVAFDTKTCTTTAGQLPANVSTQVALYTTAANIWFGDASVTADGNYPKVTSTTTATLNISNTDKVYCRTASGSAVLVIIYEQ